MVSLVGVCLAVPGSASGQLAVRNHRSASLAFLRFTPRSHTLEINESRTSYSFVMANEFRRIGPIDEDAETWRLGLEYGRGLRDGNEWWVELPVMSRSGGVLDPVIDWWHSYVLGDPNPVRDATAQGRSHIEFPGSSAFGSAVGVGDLTVGVARQIDRRLVGRVGVKLPTGNPSMLTGSGGIDVGGAVDVHVPVSFGVALDLNGAYVLQGRAPRLGNARRGVYSSAVAATWSPNGRDSWTLQWNAEQSPTKTGDPMLDGDHRVVSFGLTRNTGRDSFLQVYFSEDGDFRWFRFPGGATVGPDFTIGVRFVRTLGE